MKVLFCGAHGTGKTTTIEAIESFLLEEGFEIFDSISAKFFKPEDFKDPEKMVTKQLAFTQFQCDLFSEDKIVSSRSFADIWAYSKHLYERDGREEYKQSMDLIVEKALEDWKRGNTLFVYFPIMFDLKSVKGKELRSTNLDFQKEIERNILEFFELTGIQYNQIQSQSVEDRGKEVTKFIEERI